MSSIIDDREAYILAVQFSLLPSSTGKYEPDANRHAATRCMNLADWKDSSSILIQYTPADLPPPE